MEKSGRLSFALRKTRDESNAESDALFLSLRNFIGSQRSLFWDEERLLGNAACLSWHRRWRERKAGKGAADPGDGRAVESRRPADVEKQKVSDARLVPSHPTFSEKEWSRSSPRFGEAREGDQVSCEFKTSTDLSRTAREIFNGNLAEI